MSNAQRTGPDCTADPADAVRHALSHLPMGVVLGRTRQGQFAAQHRGTTTALGSDDAHWRDSSGSIRIRFHRRTAISMEFRDDVPPPWDSVLGTCIRPGAEWRTNYAAVREIFSMVGTELEPARIVSCYPSGSDRAVPFGFDTRWRVGDVIVLFSHHEQVECGPALYQWAINHSPR